MDGTTGIDTAVVDVEIGSCVKTSGVAFFMANALVVVSMTTGAAFNTMFF